MRSTPPPTVVTIPIAISLIHVLIYQNTPTGDYDSVTAGQYSLLLDQWGKSDASYGSNCAAITSLSGTTIAWKNPWKWAGGNKIKSYTNIQLNQGMNKGLKTISSIPVSFFFK